jgi:hypothetical protein
MTHTSLKTNVPGDAGPNREGDPITMSWELGSRVTRNVGNVGRVSSRGPANARKSHPNRYADLGATEEILEWIVVYFLSASGASIFGIVVGWLLSGSGLR